MKSDFEPGSDWTECDKHNFCSNHRHCPKCKEEAVRTLETIRPPMSSHFPTPEEHRKRLLDAALRALIQLQEQWCDCPQATEQELAFAELTLHRIRRELP